MLKKLVILGTLIFVAGCSFSYTKKTPINIDSPIIIGGLTDMTGSSQNHGIETKNVVNLRISQWNKEGGLQNGKKVEIKWRNGNCDALVAQEAAQDLITTYNVPIIIGGLCSDETIGAANATEPNKVILMSPASTSPRISDIGDFIFRTIANDNSQGALLAKHANLNNFKKIGILIESTAYTNALLDVFKNKYNGEFLEREIFPESEMVAGPQIKEFQAQNVDAIFLLTQGAEGAYKSIKSLQEATWEGGILLNEVATDNAQFFTEFKDYLTSRKATGCLYAPKTNLEKITEFQEEYKETYKEDLKYINFAASVLDSVDIIMEVLGYVDNEHNTSEIAELLYNNQHIGYTGNISFDNKGDLRATFSLFQFNENGLTDITP